MNDKPNYSGVDNYYINREQPYEVNYAIKCCLRRERITNASPELRKLLKQSLQRMRHNLAGHCMREAAYRELRAIIKAYKHRYLAAAILAKRQDA